MNTEKMQYKPESARGYIIALNKWHSRLALFASLITVSCSLYAIIGSIVISVEAGQSVKEYFQWFTANSNCLTAFSAFMIIPFAAEGIRKKHFSYPKWVAMFHYSGTVCAALTMVFSCVFISQVDPVAAFGGYNFYLHIICPLLIIASFFLVESGFHYSVKNALAAVTPSLLYGVVYIRQVVFVGKENGGWDDLYHITEYLPMAVAALLLMLLTLGISLLVRWLYNRLTLFRDQKMAARFWPEDVNPVEINIELFGLGRYMGQHANMKYVELPLELINRIACRYSLKTEDLVKPYIRGFLDSLRERQKE